MKVLLIVTEKLPVPAVRGGAIQTYIDGVLPYLANRHEVTVLGVEDPDLPPSETIGPVRYVRVPGKIYDVYQKHVLNFLRASGQQYDLIHIFNRPRLVPRVRQEAPNARIVLSMHNDMFLPGKITKKEALAAIEACERIVTISDYVGRRIAEDYPQAAHQLRTIYSGVDVNRYNPRKNLEEVEQIRHELKSKFHIEDRNVVLFVGRLSPKKGADILVRSMWYLAKHHPKTALVLVGGKWYSDNEISDYIAYVRALAERCPIPVVTTGFVAPSEVHHWFWVGDVFVCPSQWEEPLARVHYEAMAARLPIVTTARGGNPEVIVPGENGYVVSQPDDPREMAKTVGKLLGDSQLRRVMGRQGRRLAKERYRWRRVADDLLGVWEAGR
ncbi:MAG: glycosyltransferase family 4 protein [Alicyclobacillus herbarius]|uniref:glycosyltransferase family 4 protein n=1 Tax=Alicyclobacillus herbarius TaxID=122960 RepID=UPI0003FFB896|nr:glycosyltransferase family 4 protein [Alicyclobacillus herbarius]MCL6632665.1 glycosyltransferase family 4 protein [Alicyclobacillus herbarius]